MVECGKNDAVDIVKRNIIDIFEDMEDPFAEEESSVNHFVNKSGTATFRITSQNPLNKKTPGFSDHYA